jgi:Tfp pilus assembly PilM family ATPase
MSVAVSQHKNFVGGEWVDAAEGGTAEIINPATGETIAEVQRSIGFYASVHRDARIKRIIALGGTFRLPGLQKYLQQNLQLDVHRVDRLASAAPECS